MTKLSKPKRKVGRPTLYTTELAKRICDLIATTPRGIETMCKEHDWLPDHQTIKNWRAHNQEFFALYLQAKEAQGHAIVDKLWNDADNLTADTAEINRFNAIFRFQQFHLAKLAPKHFSDKPAEQAAVFTDTEKAELKNMMADFAVKHDKEY
jgi:hypothetical protein